MRPFIFALACLFALTGACIAPPQAQAGPLCAVLGRAKSAAGRVLGVQRRQDRRAARRAARGG